MCDDLRIASVSRGRKLELMVDGKAIPAYKGETVLAALTAAGIRRLRSARQNPGAPTQDPDTQSPDTKNRGALCGMGICYECRVTINGVPDQRACMTPVADGMVIGTGDSL